MSLTSSAAFPPQAPRSARYTERVVYLSTPEQIEAVTALAEENGRTVSGEIRYAVEQHLCKARRDG